jgi:hypothetical protein
VICGVEPLLGMLKGANLNAAGTDQAIPLRPGKYILRNITVTNASGTLTLAVGGIYTATGKGGTAVVSAAQAYAALSSSSVAIDLTLAAGALGVALTASTLYLNLTTAAGSTATADIYVFGDWLP